MWPKYYATDVKIAPSKHDAIVTMLMHLLQDPAAAQALRDCGETPEGVLALPRDSLVWQMMTPAGACSAVEAEAAHPAPSLQNLASAAAADAAADAAGGTAATPSQPPAAGAGAAAPASAGASKAGVASASPFSSPILGSATQHAVTPSFPPLRPPPPPPPPPLQLPSAVRYFFSRLCLVVPSSLLPFLSPPLSVTLYLLLRVCVDILFSRRCDSQPRRSLDRGSASAATPTRVTRVSCARRPTGSLRKTASRRPPLRPCHGRRHRCCGAASPAMRARGLRSRQPRPLTSRMSWWGSAAP